MSKVSSFFSEVRHEMAETRWPNAKEMRKYTVSVFTVVILFALFFFATESVITWLLSLI
ncbi:MAG TPA: preprotein translocase subunit SecE [Atopostipes sp.]|nr:preprotein translocase subunit SecE [Atopostipes sp.]